ncbi:hypothetical protein LLH00_16810 [bacterium]|nr:hypothetical protein [bacterium]
MTEDIRNFILTLPFVVILLLLLFWLIKALAPSRRDMERRDRFDQAGYETVRQTRMKEYSVMGLSVAVIVFCLGVMGYLAWQLFHAGAGAGVEAATRSMETMLMFIPAIVLLTFVAVASRRYIRRQEETLHEFNEFKAKREHALKAYDEKRRGRGLENEDGTPVTIKQKVDRSKKDRPDNESGRHRRRGK